MMTKQEYHNLLIKSATDGTFPSYDENKKCRYRFGNHKCPAGLLIKDEDYNIGIEGQAAIHLANIIELPIGLTSFQLSIIQVIHDRYAPNWDSEKFIKDINLFFSKSHD